MRLPARCGAAVVGGGPAGSALAALLARRGLDVVLLEKGAFPRDKLCGEFLSPEAQGLLAEAGCLTDVLALAPARVDRARIFDRKGRALELPLPGTALSLGRRALDEALFRHAARCGARAVEGVRVLGVQPDPAGAGFVLSCEDGGSPRTVEAGVAVGAWGRGPTSSPAPFAAMKRHHKPSPGAAGNALARELDGWVEVHLFDGGYCGVSFIEGGVVNVCALVAQGFLRALPAPRWEGVRARLGEASPSLGRRLAALDPCEEGFLSAARIGFEPRPACDGTVPLVGDAAGMIAPLCGDGQAMALESARRLAALLGPLPSTAPERAELARRWQAEWTRAFRPRLRVGRWLQAALLRPRLGSAALAAVRLLPPLAAALVRATRGEGQALTNSQNL